MNTDELARIARETTTVYRKGEGVKAVQLENVTVVEIQNYPHADTAANALIDMVFVEIGVNLPAAQAQRSAIVAAFGDYIGPESGLDYRQGPSYLHIGADLGDQETALRLMALCSVLHIGQLMTPMHFGAEGREAQEFAGRGFIYLTSIGAGNP